MKRTVSVRYCWVLNEFQATFDNESDVDRNRRGTEPYAGSVGGRQEQSCLLPDPENQDTVRFSLLKRVLFNDNYRVALHHSLKLGPMMQICLTYPQDY